MKNKDLKKGHDIGPLFKSDIKNYYFFVHLTDPLFDGAVCQLGLREGRLPNAKVRGHQVEGGAGAPRHPLHSLQGAPECLHINTSRRPGPVTLASHHLSLSLSILSNLSLFTITISSGGGAWVASRALVMLMSLVRHMTMLSEGEPTHKPLQSQAFSEGKKSPFTSLMDGVIVIIMAVILFLMQVV